MKIDNKLILENSKDLNILYVEDEESIRESTLELLGNYFNSIETAVDGVDGLKKYKAYCKKEKTPFDMVITDIHMPNMNGLEMGEAIKELHSEQMIVFVTAFNEVDYLYKAVNMGAGGFLTKPVELEELKKLLYITTQMVSDRKLLIQYYNKIENLNILGMDMKDSSNFSSAKDILEDLVSNKEKISHIWVDKKVVVERLEAHAIDVEFFRSRYAIKVIEYFLNVIRGEAEMGNCPVIFIMLDFFKNKNLPLEDIFMICVLFKNSMSSYVFTKYSFNQELFDDISLILDKNFEGVIINYLKLKDETETHSSKQIKKAPAKEEQEQDEHVNYVEYVLESDIYELQDLEEDIDSLSISVIESSSSTVEDCQLLGDNINRYGNILSNYPLFSELGKYITKLGVNFTKNSEILFNDKERMLNISALIEGFVNDLIVWRKEIFENNIVNAHFLDNSFFSNVDTIIMFIEYDESASEEENFDDDMFF